MDARAPSSPTVVLVEDDSALLAALKFALEVEGYAASGFHTGEELLAMQLPSHNACLVIGDKLEGISGLDALETLRARGVSLPAILITSYAPGVRVRAARAKAVVVEKPLLGDSLMARIRALLAH